MRLNSYLIVDRRDGSTYQVWAENRQTAMTQYVVERFPDRALSRGDADYVVVRLRATQTIPDPKTI